MDVIDIIELSNEITNKETKVDLLKYTIKKIIVKLDEKDPTTKHNIIQLKKLYRESRKILETTAIMTDLINSLLHKKIKRKYEPDPIPFWEDELEDESKDESKDDSSIKPYMITLNI